MVDVNFSLLNSFFLVAYKFPPAQKVAKRLGVETREAMNNFKLQKQLKWQLEVMISLWQLEVTISLKHYVVMGKSSYFMVMGQIIPIVMRILKIILF
jgi:hypothetical protein